MSKAPASIILRIILMVFMENVFDILHEDGSWMSVIKGKSPNEVYKVKTDCDFGKRLEGIQVCDQSK